MKVVKIDTLATPELEPYARLTEAQLRNRLHASEGLFICESLKVIRVALAAGVEPVSFLCEEKFLDSVPDCGVTVYTAGREVLKGLTGYELSRGVLCCMRRPAGRGVGEVLDGARRVAVLDTVVNSENTGAVFRAAAALGLDAVLLTRTCCDPLNRRACRVSMGTVFQLPWTWLDHYRHGVDSIMNNPVATSARFMKNSSNAAQNWVSDAAMVIIKELTGFKNIDCAIMNKGGIRTDMPQGTVTEGVIGSMFPFDNRFVVLEMPGNELIESIKLMCGRGGDAVSKELKAVYNEKGELIKATLKGKKIDPKKTYIVATIDYLANGGDYMTPMTRCKRLFVDTQKYGNHILQYVKRLEAEGKKIDAKDEVRIQKK